MCFSQNYTCLGTTVCVVSTGLAFSHPIMFLEGLRLTNFARAPIPPPFSEYVLPSKSVATLAYNEDCLVVIHSDWTVSMC